MQWEQQCDKNTNIQLIIILRIYTKQLTLWNILQKCATYTNIQKFVMIFQLCSLRQLLFNCENLFSNIVKYYFTLNIITI